jgi:hypothetical protein
MNRKHTGASRRGKGRPQNRRFDRKPATRPPATTGRPRTAHPDPGPLKIVERRPEGSGAPQEAGTATGASQPTESAPGPFRVLIAVHRPRFRGRAERAAARIGWEVTVLLNKQDPVGIVAKPPRPPDLLSLSGDFGRQRDYAIFRAVQSWRQRGMRLIGLVDDCETAPDDYPDSAPESLCDVCLVPPYKTADLRALLVRLYEQMRGQPAPPPLRTLTPDAEDAEEPAED